MTDRISCSTCKAETFYSDDCVLHCSKCYKILEKRVEVAEGSEKEVSRILSDEISLLQEHNTILREKLDCVPDEIQQIAYDIYAELEHLRKVKFLYDALVQVSEIIINTLHAEGIDPKDNWVQVRRAEIEKLSKYLPVPSSETQEDCQNERI